jgi:hypothetical protein
VPFEVAADSDAVFLAEHAKELDRVLDRGELRARPNFSPHLLIHIDLKEFFQL